MGIRYIEHSDMCGCNRCARAWEYETPYRVYDKIDDPNILECGCDKYLGCDCDYWESFDD